MTINNGTEPAGENFSWDDGEDSLDLSFGETPAAEEPADLSLADVEAAVTVTDLSGAPAKTVPVTAPDPNAAATAAPGTPPVATAALAAAPVDPAAPAQQPAASAQPGPTESQPVVDIEAYVTENSQAIIDNLATSHFKIDAKEAEALGFEPEVTAWIEKQNAKNFLLTMVQVNKALQTTLPTVVANLVNLTNQVKQTQEGFYGEFPDLGKEEYVPHLKQLAVTLRGMHPKMPKDEFQTLLGSTAMTLWKITPTAKAAPAQRGPNGQRVVRGPARPFTPAGSAVPQRNMGGNGQAPVDPLHAMNAFLQSGADEFS